MAEILMINVPYSGHTNPTLPLTKCLIKRGHNVYYINAEEFRSKIEATGATFIPYTNYPKNPSEQQKKTMCFRAAYDTALKQTEKFDLLIYEMFFYPGIAIAERLGIPCVRQFSQSAWNDQTMKKATRLFAFLVKVVDKQVMGKKNILYMDLKSKGLADAVINDKPDLNIVYVPEIFQLDRESFGPQYLFTIPHSSIQIENKAVPGVKIPYDKMKYPIVYISLGSIISNKGFCKECIRAFGNKELSVILNTGKVSTYTLGKIPDNIYAYSFVPQIEVLQHADVFLTHCGMNSVNEAMALGVPMVAMPFVNDQISNAKRVVELGIGKRVRSFPSSGRQLYNFVMDVLVSDQIHHRSKAIENQLKDSYSLMKVVLAIEELLKK